VCVCQYLLTENPTVLYSIGLRIFPQTLIFRRFSQYINDLTAGDIYNSERVCAVRPKPNSCIT
jgi:hypothetical protein